MLWLVVKQLAAANGGFPTLGCLTTIS